MNSTLAGTSIARVTAAPERTHFAVLAGLGVSHLLNDLIQSMIPAIYPLLKSGLGLDFTEIGLITLALMLTASLLQPLVGLYTDRHPSPYSLVVGMGFSLCGLLLLAVASRFAIVILAAALVGVGSSIFHPESSRMARTASGGRPGLAQSLFQVGGNAGSAIGPLLAALVVVPNGQASIAWFSAAALCGIAVLGRVGAWYRARLEARRTGSPAKRAAARAAFSTRRIAVSVAILLALIFSKYFYIASLSSYYTFYLIHRFGVSIQASQLYLFLFLGALAVGTLLGGSIGDRFGRRLVIWGSILGVLPFTLVLPYANLFWTAVLTVPIGLVLASAFPSILVYAQDLVPGRLGVISGLFYGFAFGMGGVGAAVLGALADRTSIEFVYGVCAFLPLIGLLAIFLPDLEKTRAAPLIPPAGASAPPQTATSRPR
jgi:FSR family fosmidomycin resistance protein-like MFS transporter